MMRTICLFLIGSVLLPVCGCQRSPQPEGLKVAAPISPIEDESVQFQITPVRASGTQEWLCVYSRSGKTAKFRIQLDAPKCSTMKDVEDFQVCNGQGKFLAVAGSDSDQLLEDLRHALHAKSLLSNPKRVPSVAFEYVSFGKNQSRIVGGGFAQSPRGDWIPMKLFLGKGEEEGEVFFNINPVAGQGEFSIKDKDYGDSVLTKLAPVL